jgi:hypothetical protein
MKRVISHIRRPVKRRQADTYLLITLLSFAASVSLTRLFLSITGYPQVGGGEFHIAHVLWGGLFLFVASLLPLMLANRWAYRVGAVVAGIGMGLFIDEVGKFITQSNNYFYPAAAPIVYAFFLLTVLLYSRVRRAPRRSARAELYRALDDLEELLDHDLEADERADLEQRLSYVAERDEGGDIGRLASQILTVVGDPALALAPQSSSLVERLVDRLADIESRWFSRRVTKTIIVSGLLVIGGLSLSRLWPLFRPQLAADQIQALIELGRIGSARGLAWYTARVALEACTGALLVVSAVFFMAGRDEHGSGLGYLGLLLALTTVDLVVFYFEQFGTILKALGQFVLLLVVIRYRGRFLMPHPSPDPREDV